jgi:hypothetical protein
MKKFYYTQNFFHTLNKTLIKIWSIDPYLVNNSKIPLKTQTYNFSSTLLCIIIILLLSYLDLCLD